MPGERRPIINLFRLTEDGLPAGGHSAGIGFTVAWHDGAAGTSRNGAYVEDVLAAVKARFEFWQSQRTTECPENAEVLQYLDDIEDALEARKKRLEEGE